MNDYDLAFFEDHFKEVPADDAILDYLLQRQLQVTEALCVFASIDPTNSKPLEFLSQHIPRAVKTLEDIQRLRSVNTLADDSEALSASFDYEDTNYQAMAIDAAGLPLSSASEVLGND